VAAKRPTRARGPGGRERAERPVRRGRTKLDAALARFGLAGRVRGARCIDVGASTGGFSDRLLAGGARSVVAIDVGHGQLDPHLRADPRVTALERTDFKKLALREAPGPFDFFTVDVSFVAARSMLRALAFRLRPGAEGVVLVKPQFELPDRRVRGGDVSDPRLRAEAVARVRARADALGFEVVEVMDSPVPGGSGTVELLAHLRFGGRSERLPRPGERLVRPEAPPAAREPAFAERSLRWFAVTAPGVEPATLREVEALPGARDARLVPGGVEFAGALEVGMRANLWLRSAGRVLLRVGSVEARDFALLRRRAGALPWRELVAAGAPVAVKATAHACRLFHTGAVAETLALAVGDRLARGAAGAAPAPDAGGAPAATVLARGERDRWTLSLDASGELLHRRGWRLETARAPLRETLGAALLLLCEYDPERPFLDPLCGAGTLPIEAASLALRRAPGLGRSFAFARWPAFDPALWDRLRAEAEAAALAEVPAPIAGCDRSEAAIAAARRNAARAGVAAQVALQVLPLAEVRAPRFRPARPPGAPPAAGPRGLVLANPPWGRRLGDPRAARATYADLGRLLRERFRGWRAGVLVADPTHADALRLTPASEHRLASGGVRLRLLRFDLS
jgi:putative N6-adenine-specific DNA methylase